MTTSRYDVNEIRRLFNLVPDYKVVLSNIWVSRDVAGRRINIPTWLSLFGVTITTQSSNSHVLISKIRTNE